MTLLEVLRRSTGWLEQRGIESPRLDVEILMAHALGIERIDLYLQYDRPLSEEELALLRGQIRERGSGRPVAYLIGQREFYSLTFAVDDRVLIPRPETEHLVECGVRALTESGSDTPAFVDVGTGSGCVAVAVLHELPAARGIATDISPGALTVARSNAERHLVGDRLVLLEGDLLEPLRDRAEHGRLDAVLANPPYVVRGDPTLAPDVRDHEPEAALFVPGEDPVEIVQQIAEQALGALRPGGRLALEVGAGSAEAACLALADLGYENVSSTPDLAGIERIVQGDARGGATS